jgi:Fic family protein
MGLSKVNVPGRIYGIVDDLFVQPFTTASLIRQKYGVSHPTAKSDLETLAELHIVSRLQLKLRRQIAYVCDPILKITYEDSDESP